MKYNRTAEATTLLQEITDWCARTGTRETAIGHVLFLHPGFVGLARLRLTVSEEKEELVRRFMGAHPNGWIGELPKTHANGTKPNRQRFENAHHEMPRVSRDPCPRCGVRSDLGCRHSIGAAA